ncbi:quinone oxidoreductase [Methylobacterium sp. Leaf117]|nr:quinone oxidoreductase [Methylobacterium sp. Leaf117]
MKACRVHQFGLPSVITLEDIPRPEPGEGEVLVKVHAAGVGPWDAWIRAGRSLLPQPLPLTLGSDVSGTVAALGQGVSRFTFSDAVFGVTNKRFTDGYAEYALASADMLAIKPKGLAHVDAASLPVVAVTAWQALFDHAHVGNGQTVLILGAAGNVGTFAVQFARAAGAYVIAGASTAEHAYLRSIGANDVIDIRSERFEDKTILVDVVMDLVGGEIQARSFSIIKPGGTLVSAVSRPDVALAATHGVTAAFFFVDVTTDILDQIAAEVFSGRVVTQIGALLPLASARTAHEMLEGSRPRPRGKIVLRVVP